MQHNKQITTEKSRIETKIPVKGISINILKIHTKQSNCKSITVITKAKIN